MLRDAAGYGFIEERMSTCALHCLARQTGAGDAVPSKVLRGALRALLGTLWVSRSFFLARVAVAPALAHVLDGKIEA